MPSMLRLSADEQANSANKANRSHDWRMVLSMLLVEAVETKVGWVVWGRQATIRVVGGGVSKKVFAWLLKGVSMEMCDVRRCVGRGDWCVDVSKMQSTNERMQEE